MPHSVTPLWSGSEKLSDPADIPTLTFYPAEGKGNGACVLVLPGGGYGGLADHEGKPVAEALNAHGFQAAVLKYRLGPRHRHPAMIFDAQRALRLLRSTAKKRGFRPQSIAVLGFSAGGHLASTLAVHHGSFVSEDDDLATDVSARPDAAVLCYPVIDLAGEHAHAGSRGNLLGAEPDPALLERLSTQTQVCAATPPTFLWHTSDDGGVALQNSLGFAAACQTAGVPVELHAYETGRHGLGLAEDDPNGVATWLDHATQFLSRHLGK